MVIPHSIAFNANFEESRLEAITYFPNKLKAYRQPLKTMFLPMFLYAYAIGRIAKMITCGRGLTNKTFVA